MVFGFSDDGVQILGSHHRLQQTDIMVGAVPRELDSRAVQGERLGGLVMLVMLVMLVQRMKLELP